jgi:hypothetical protein
VGVCGPNHPRVTDNDDRERRSLAGKGEQKDLLRIGSKEQGVALILAVSSQMHGERAKESEGVVDAGEESGLSAHQAVSQKIYHSHPTKGQENSS